MFPHARFLLLALAAGLASPSAVRCDDKPPRPLVGCAAAVDNYFQDEVWAKVGRPKCLTCHRKGGDTESSKFVLINPRKVAGAARDNAMRNNRAAFARMAAVKQKDKSRMLLKVLGELDHGGADVLTTDSASYRILADFVRRVNTPPRSREGSQSERTPPPAPPRSGEGSPNGFLPHSASGGGWGGGGVFLPLSASGRGAGGEGLPLSPLSASGRGVGGRGSCERMASRWPIPNSRCPS